MLLVAVYKGESMRDFAYSTWAMPSEIDKITFI